MAVRSLAGARLGGFAAFRGFAVPVSQKSDKAKGPAPDKETFVAHQLIKEGSIRHDFSMISLVDCNFSFLFYN